MKFNPHSEIEGLHALLSPSSYHWLSDEPEKLLARAANRRAAALGTRLHAFAHEAIALRQHAINNSQTVNLYINDCIGYRMTNEVPLFYSWDAFGHADALDFRKEGEVMVLRIFDLKTGVQPASVKQLKCYAALFCLEYKIRPMEIEYDLRIYQNDEVKMFETDPEEIMYIMDRFTECNKILERGREEEVI